jgi:hypothetical protein
MTLASIPRLGVGAGWRPEAGRQLLSRLDEFDVLEVLADTVVGKGKAAWDEARDLAELVPVALHGVNLSLASTDCLDHRGYLRDLARLVRELRVPFYSEHFALTKSGKTRIGHLSPVWFTEAQLKVFIRNTAEVQDILGVPLVLENISVPYEIPGAEMSEIDFINETARRTGCGLLIDAENLAINAANLGFDPDLWLKRLNRDVVVEIHLAGGLRDGKLWVDTHSRPVSTDVWALYGRIVASCRNLRCVIIERDEDFDGFKGVAQEAARSRRVWNAHA